MNDDYWAIDSLHSLGFVGSLNWYWTSFQGNVGSWFFILIHEYSWINGVSPLASALSFVVSLAILAGASWGGLRYMGFIVPRGWRGSVVIGVTTLVALVSLTSVVSPSTLTFAYYVPSTIVHVWPWCLGMWVLGFVSGRTTATTWRGTWVLCGAAGLVAGLLGFVESIALLTCTGVFAVFAWRRGLWDHPVARNGWAWAVGLAVSSAIQFLSPSTWLRATSPETGITDNTNVQAVYRLLAALTEHVHPSTTDAALSIFDAVTWTYTLVPLAVVTELLIRPGLVGIALLSSFWVIRRPRDFTLSRQSLLQRVGVLAIAVATSACLYAVSGAAYAFAGRHVTGLSIAVCALAVGFGALSAPWWTRHASLLRAAVAVSVILLVALGLYQASLARERAEAWDAAQEVNRARLAGGDVAALLDVGLKGGLSQSGLRDHEGSEAYVIWLRRTGGSK